MRQQLTAAVALRFVSLFYACYSGKELSAEAFLSCHGQLFARYLPLEEVAALLEDAPASSDALACVRLLHHAAQTVGVSLHPAGGGGFRFLSTVFSGVSLDGGTPDAAWYYPPRPYALSALFPQPLEQLEADADALLHHFEAEMALLDATSPASFEDFMVLWDTVLRRNLWCVAAPMADGADDISLYDALRLTLALAVALWERQALLPDDSPPFLLVAGAFSGIQNYIFAAASKNASGVAERLRARSFLVNAMAEATAYELLFRCRLPRQNILMLTGGKFQLLLPNLPATRALLDGFLQETDRHLYQAYRGDIAVHLASAEVDAAALADYSATAAALSHRLGEQKLRPFQGALTSNGVWDEAAFVLYRDLSNRHTCSYCGKRLIDQSRTDCDECEAQQQLGNSLTVARYFSYHRNGQGHPLLHNHSVALSARPIAGSYLLKRADDAPLQAALCRFPLCGQQTANHIPRLDSGQPRPFVDIAARSSGRRLLGLLKADIDQLGFVFAEGLRHGGPRQGAMARSTALSGMLEAFFSGWVTALLQERYPDVYSVFSGGDDLFLIGPWDLMPALALDIHKAFGALAAGNPAFTLSAAITLFHPQSRFALMAEEGERRLKQVKDIGDPLLYGENSGRNGVFFLGEVYRWRDFADQLAVGELLTQVLENRLVAPQILHRIATYSKMYRRFLVDHDVFSLMFEPLLSQDRSRNYSAELQRTAPDFWRYAEELCQNAANYKAGVLKNLYFADAAVRYAQMKSTGRRKEEAM